MAEKPIVLITGAAGNIGRSLAQALQQHCMVVGLDVASGDTDYPIIEVDLTDEKTVAEALARFGSEHGHRIAIVVHLAAFFDFSGEDKPQYKMVNVDGSRNPIRALQAFEVEQFVYHVGVGQPKAAGEERAFFAADPIIDLICSISQHEPTADKFLLDSPDRPDYARVVGRQETNLWDEEEARIQSLAAIVLREAIALGTKAVFANTGVDRVAKFPPKINRAIQPEMLAGLDSAVEGDPAH